MKLDVLICRGDGTQILEHREVPDDWFSQQEVPEMDVPETPEMA